MSGYGCIAYADRDIGDLMHVAMGVINKSPVKNPEAARLVSYLPVHPEELMVDMDYVGKGAGKKNSKGWEESAGKYFQTLYDRDPELFAGEYNRANIADGKVRDGTFFVDEQWAEKYPQYRPFLGEQLHHHHIGQDGQAVALPASIHHAYGVIHNEEKQLGVTESAENYTRYVRERVENGEAYDGKKFQGEYLNARGLMPTLTPQRVVEGAMETHMAEIGRQQLSETQKQVILTHLKSDPGAALKNEREPASAREILTETPQCVPNAYTADYGWSEPANLEKGTRLIQMCALKDGATGGFFLREEDAVKRGLYDPATGEVDARAFSRAAQLAPYTDGALKTTYMPDARIVTVNSGNVEAIQGPARNNTAYGVPKDGEAPVTQIFIPNARGLEQSGSLVQTGVLKTRNRELTNGEAAACYEGAAIQEQYDRQLIRMYERSRAEDLGHPDTVRGRSEEDGRNLNIERADEALKREGAKREDVPNPDTRRHIDYLSAKHEAYGNYASFARDMALEDKISLLHDQYQAQGQGWQDGLARGEKKAVEEATKREAQLERRSGIAEEYRAARVSEPEKPVPDKAESPAEKSVLEKPTSPAEKSAMEKPASEKVETPVEKEAGKKAETIAEKGVEIAAAPEAAAAAAVKEPLEKAAPEKAEAPEEKSAMEKAAPERAEAPEEKSAMEKAAPEKAEAPEEKSAMERAAPEKAEAPEEKSAMERAAPEKAEVPEEKSAMERAAPEEVREESRTPSGQDQSEAPSISE